jgi:methanogenic corrinoid protein MtbC1
VTRSAPAGERPLATLCYRSKASRVPNADDLANLLSLARSRNKAAGVTGMLVHEGGRFFQWLEGPSEALDDLWTSIRRDDRHGEIELLGEGVTPIRLFSEWDLRFLSRSPSDAPSDETAPSAPSTVNEAAAQLGRLALAGDDQGMDALVQERRAHGEDVQTLCRLLLEPAAHQLGDWWCQDRCDCFEITLALARLQNLVRSLESKSDSNVRVAIEGRRVLISPPPLETHLLGATLLGGFFRQAGWSVQAEFPKTDNELVGLVSTHWFDAIALTLSDVFTRQERLAALIQTISDVRAASKNPTMAVIVGGRAFRPDGSNESSRVGADVHYASASDAVPSGLPSSTTRTSACGKASAIRSRTSMMFSASL